MDKRPKEMSTKELELAQEYYPGVTWNFQEIEGKPPRRRRVCLEAVERRKVCSKVKDDMKSVLDWEVATLAGNKDSCQINGELVDGFKERDKTTYLDVKIKRNLEIGPTSPHPIPMQFSFEGAEPTPQPMDPNVTLSKGQCPSSLAEIVKTKNLLRREGIGPLTRTPKLDGAFPIAIDAITAEFCEEPPQISSDQSRGGGGTSWVNPRKHAGEAPQHKKVGYMPMVYKGLVSWTPKKQEADVISTMEAEEDDAAMVGMQMWLHSLGDPFWELFPLLININKRPPKIYKQTHQQRDQMLAHTLGLRSD